MAFHENAVTTVPFGSTADEALRTALVRVGERRRREREPRSSAGTAAGDNGASRRGAYTRYGGGFGGASPRATNGPVDERRFNVREWESAHYGLKGASAEARQSQYVRNLAREQRARQAGAAAMDRARQRARQQGNGLGMLLFSMGLCTAVWTAVFRTNEHRYRSKR